MEVHVLASGSTGNAVFIEMDDRQFLVDAGISATRIERGLKALGTHPSALSAIFITHEHTDHIKGLPVFLKRHPIPVFSRPGTWQNMDIAAQLPADCIHAMEGALDFGCIHIQSFDISHDAAEPAGYVFQCQDKKLALATDLGIFTSSVVQALSDADAIVLEANHDPDMLQNGPYPRFLKERIRGRRGHLSNYDTAGLLGCIHRKARTQVFLAHLSQENNCPDLADFTIRQQLEHRGINVGTDLNLLRTYPEQANGCSF